MISKLDDEVQLENHIVCLGCTEFSNGKIEGQGHLFLKEFRREWQTPVWVFDI